MQTVSLVVEVHSVSHTRHCTLCQHLAGLFARTVTVCFTAPLELMRTYVQSHGKSAHMQKGMSSAVGWRHAHAHAPPLICLSAPRYHTDHARAGEESRNCTFVDGAGSNAVARCSLLYHVRGSSPHCRAPSSAHRSSHATLSDISLFHTVTGVRMSTSSMPFNQATRYA